MQRLALASLPVLALALLPGCGGGVRVPMGQVPFTSGMGTLIGTNARQMGCQGRPRRGRFQLRCPGIQFPDHRPYMVVYDDGRIECVADEGFESDCQNVYQRLIAGTPGTAGGAVEGMPGQPVPDPAMLVPGTPVYTLWNGRWYASQVTHVLGAGVVRITYEGWASSYDENVGMDRLRLR